MKNYSRRKLEALEGYLFVSPVILGVIIFVAWPVLLSLYYSFTEYQLLKSPRWIGLDNYKQLTGSEEFWHSLRLTFIYTLVSVPFNLAAGFFLALLLKRSVPGVRWFRTIVYLPVVVPIVALGVLWKQIYSPQYGLANQVLNGLGLPSYTWFSHPDSIMTSLVLMSLWQAGAAMIIWIAGLEGVPAHLYEAAIVDGASPIRRFWHVTVPMLTPVIFFNLIMGLIGALQVFGQILVTTGGGPVDASNFLMVLIYKKAFASFEMGYASALSWVLFVIIMALTAVVFRTSHSWVHYEGGKR